MRSGNTVLVQGSGGVSIFALQLAKALGARVIATTSTTEKAERLVALGADAVVNYKEVPQWGEQVRVLSDGGVDRVVEVGGPGTIGQSLRSVRPGGEISLIGLVGGKGADVNFFDMFMSGASFRHIAVGSRDGLEQVTKAISMANIIPIVDRVFDFDEAKQAYDYMDQGRHFGKVVIRCT